MNKLLMFFVLLCGVMPVVFSGGVSTILSPEEQEAIRNGTLPLDELDIASDKSKAILFYAVEHDSVAVVQQLLELGIDVNCTNRPGWTPLMSAVLKKQVPVVDKLLRYGAQCNVVSHTGGFTPLKLAIEHGDIELVKKLVKAGACVDDNVMTYASCKAHVNRAKIIPWLQAKLSNRPAAQDSRKEGAACLTSVEGGYQPLSAANDSVDDRKQEQNSLLLKESHERSSHAYTNYWRIGGAAAASITLAYFVKQWLALAAIKKRLQASEVEKLNGVELAQLREQKSTIIKKIVTSGSIGVLVAAAALMQKYKSVVT